MCNHCGCNEFQKLYKMLKHNWGEPKRVPLSLLNVEFVCTFGSYVSFVMDHLHTHARHWPTLGFHTGFFVGIGTCWTVVVLRVIRARTQEMFPLRMLLANFDPLRLLLVQSGTRVFELHVYSTTLNSRRFLCVCPPLPYGSKPWTCLRPGLFPEEVWHPLVNCSACGRASTCTLRETRMKTSES